MLDLAEVRFADRGVLAQLRGRGGVHDRARLKDVAAGGDLERHVRVLLDEQERGALLVDLADDLEDPLYEQGRETHRGLVEEQEFGAAHEGAADGEHLLLAAAHGASLLLRALFEAREELEDAIHVLPYPGAVVSVVRAHLQVLEDGHAEEDLAPLRALGDALADHVVRGHALYLLPVEDHPALPRWKDAV